MIGDEPELDYATATAQVMAEADLPEPTEPLPKLHLPLSNDPSPEQKATQLRDAVPAAYVYGAASGIFKDMLDLDSCRVYLNDLLQSAGNPSDPIARMMIEQLAMAHHAIGRLHVRAATRESLPEVIAYHGVLARLMSEFRKTSLALQVFRANAAEQTGSRQQQAQGTHLHTNGTGTIPAPGAAVAPQRSKLEGNKEVAGRDRTSHCA